MELKSHRRRLRFAVGLSCLFFAGPVFAQERPAVGWPEYGGDAGGMHYSPLADITPENVERLEVAWTYRHGQWSDGKGDWSATSAFELTPIVVDGTLYGCTPMNRVFALDPETGQERWSFDPEIDPAGRYANQLICRGVAFWRDPERAPDQACARRILTATNDARLIALDAASGERCADFGEGGQVDLKQKVGEELWYGEYQVTSAPTMVGDLVAVGSAVSDNARTDAPSGVVRGYDVRTGAVRWAWDLAPPGYPRPADGSYTRGTPNVWAPMSADAERDLLFVPTGNPSPDYYRGGLPPTDHYGSSVVALRASTGEVVWHFQTVHHDLWDFDVPAQPTLATLRREGRPVPAVIQATKMGHVFVLHRETGEPLFPVEERPVPQNSAPGETLSPTQPFPVKPPPLAPSHALTADDAWGLLFFDRRSCRKRIEALRNDGIFTPPTLQGSIMYPGNAGGSNWGGVSVDPERQILIVKVINIPWVVQLIPREQVESERRRTPGREVARQKGTPFGMRRDIFFSALGLPCIKPPWGWLYGIDLATGDVRWQVKYGTTRDVAPVPIAWELGVPSVGGQLVTAAGLVFMGAASDDYLRAFDVETGEELWKARLPAGGQATPMSYRVREGGRQYLVMAAGGHGRAGTTLGDSLIAYALPE
jgi:quinoprotein glucose dehydrogenase